MVMMDSAIVPVVVFVVGALWLREHWRLVDSLMNFIDVTPYGILTELHEVFVYHLRFLFQGLLLGADASKRDRQTVLQQTEDAFRRILKPETGSNVLITHSCRVIFLTVINALLNEAEQKTGKRKIRICIGTIHFGSFYKLLKSMVKPGECEIEYYEVDYKREDWTLDESTVDPEKVKDCDLIMCQHIFGVPLKQDIFWELGKKFNIPILEDCVQSGSLYGTYKGNPLSDIVMWSGGLDKTPSCLGGGLGCFRPTPHGTRLFQKCVELIHSYPLDTFSNRLASVLKQSIHLIIAKNSFCCHQMMGILLYFLFTKKGQHIDVYPIALKVRQDKSLAPFEHSVAKFCVQPSVYHLRSILYGLQKTNYRRTAEREVEHRKLLLSIVPREYHCKLWPWLTAEVLKRHEANLGIQEFPWIASEPGNREKLLKFLNDNLLICLINTTWEYSNSQSVGAEILDNMVYLPNWNEMDRKQMIQLGAILTRWCQVEYNGPMKQ